MTQGKELDFVGKVAPAPEKSSKEQCIEIVKRDPKDLGRTH